MRLKIATDSDVKEREGSDRLAAALPVAAASAAVAAVV
jgi:hypothetical protein